MAVDPVCKMNVNEKTAKHKTVYTGKTYYFCAPGCKIVFEENPEKYLSVNRQSLDLAETVTASRLQAVNIDKVISFFNH